MEKYEAHDTWDKQVEIDETGYLCPLCKDTGWLVSENGAYPCSCRNERILELKKKKANISNALKDKRFDNFDLSYYPQYMPVNINNSEEIVEARKLAEDTLNAAKDFVYLVKKKKTPRGLILQGDVGRGKTFLAAAIANELIINNIDILFLILPEFLEELRFSFQNGGEFNEAEIMQRAEKAKILILDDLGAHNYSEWTKNKIFTLLNYRLNHQLPCVITTNLTIDEMDTVIGSRFISRILEMCDFYRLFSDEDIRLRQARDKKRY